jgi:hypothetical protein
MGNLVFQCGEDTFKYKKRSLALKQMTRCFFIRIEVYDFFLSEQQPFLVPHFFISLGLQQLSNAACPALSAAILSVAYPSLLMVVCMSVADTLLSLYLIVSILVSVFHSANDIPGMSRAASILSLHLPHSPFTRMVSVMVLADTPTAHTINSAKNILFMFVFIYLFFIRLSD